MTTPDPPEPDRGTPAGIAPIVVPPPTQQGRTLIRGQTGGDKNERAKGRRKSKAKPRATLARPAKTARKKAARRKPPTQGAATGGGRKKAKSPAKGTGPRRKAKRVAGVGKKTKKGPGRKASIKRNRA